MKLGEQETMEDAVGLKTYIGPHFSDYNTFARKAWGF